MPLQPGTRLGPYSVTAKIGEGGMGEVYRARDTKLDRDVALKVLPQAFTDDPDRLARFEREAKVLASLNHPNIGHIYGLEEAEGTRALVLELIEGPTLADRIAQGPLPIDEALPIAKQIAEALEAAHEAGVIHRDLKPANIKVRQDGTVKVLDFGLAKALDTTPEGDPSLSPTLTAAATQMGVIMGTAAYMSPEQARGKPTDRRADIWSFGVVLFEMLTGQRAFAGEDVSLTLSEVLQREPEWDTLPPDVPIGLTTYLRRCLHKDPTQRVQAVGDMRLAMEGAFETTGSALPSELSTTQPARWRQALPWVAGMVVASVVTGLGVWSVTRPESPLVVRLTVAHDDVSPLHIAVRSPDVAIAPNGESVAYLTGSVGEGGERLHVRPLDQLTSEILVAEGELNHPFFSPDSQSLGFYDRSVSPPVLQRVAVRGGPTSTISDLPGGDLTGASWGADDTIVFATADNASGLWQVAAVGGEPRQLTTPDAEKGEIDHVWPEILPGGEAVVFTIQANIIEESQIAVLSLDTLEQKVVLSGGFFPQYFHTGHLLYAVQGNLWAVGFDLGRMETIGDPVPVQEDVLTKLDGGADFGVSANGSLVYVTGEESGAAPQRSLVWVDRQGTEEAVAAEPRPYEGLALSPDGQRVALGVTDPSNWDIWLYDLARESPTRFTLAPGVDRDPIWMPDGDRLVWSSFSDGSYNAVSKAADGTGDIEQLTNHADDQGASTISPDGKTALIWQVRQASVDVGIMSLDDPETTDWLFENPFRFGHSQISPDGRWIAYTSDEEGQDEIYVRPFPNVNDDRAKVSRDGGFSPRWGPNSDELFFQAYQGTDRESGNVTLMAAQIETEPRLLPGTPAALFGGPYRAGELLFNIERPYDVAEDGQRFLIIKEPTGTDEAAATDIILVQNFDEEMTRLFPDQ